MKPGIRISRGHARAGQDSSLKECLRKLSIQKITALALGLMLCTAPAAGADTDERQVRNLPTSYPWYTCTKVRLGSQGNGRGSGILIAKCTILTCGHVVYNRKSDSWRPVFSVHPGSYYSESLGASVDPFGSQPDVGRATNTKWVDTGNSKYDYGAVFIGDSFADLGVTTYIPVSFEQRASYINSSGYPVKNLPSSSSGATREQWWAHGDVKSHTARKMKYEATSTGGASGAGVWIYYGQTGERRLIAINRGHHNSDNDGTGVRLVSQNEDIIRDWMHRDDCCSSGGGTTARVISFPELLLKRIDLQGRPIEVLSPQQLQLVPAEQFPNPPPPACKIMQWIEGTFYEWEEFHVAGDDVHGPEEAQPGVKVGRPPLRFIRLLAPENRILSTEEAAVLLSASLLWQKPAQPVAPVIYHESDNIVPVEPEPDTLEDNDDPELVLLAGSGSDHYFGGLSHTPLRDATVTVESNQVRISNLGTSGQDGVGIALGQAQGWRAKLVHQLNAANRPDGSRIEWMAYGEKDGQADQLVIRGWIERSQDELALYADGAPMGITAFDLEVLSNGVVVAQTTVNSGRIARLRAPVGTLPRVPDVLELDWEAIAGRNYCWTRWFFDSDLTGRACEVVLEDLGGSVVISNSDTLRIRPVSATATLGALSRVELLGLSSGDFWLRDEAAGYLGAYLQAGGDTTLVTESNRVRFLAGSNGVIQAHALAPLLTDMKRHCLAFHTPGLALAAPGRTATLRVGDALGSFGALTLRRLTTGELAVSNDFAGLGSTQVVIELFSPTSGVARLLRPAGALGTLSGAGRIVTAGAAQGRVPVWSVVFDAPMVFTPDGAGSAKDATEPATGFRIYPNPNQVRDLLRVLDRYDLETLNEERQEWFDQVIIDCPGSTEPTLDRVTVGGLPAISFSSEAGVEYVLEYLDRLDGGAPILLQRVMGTGDILRIQDPTPASSAMRFYRVVPAQESLWEGLRGMW